MTEVALTCVYIVTLIANIMKDQLRPKSVSAKNYNKLMQVSVDHLEELEFPSVSICGNDRFTCQGLRDAIGLPQASDENFNDLCQLYNISECDTSPETNQHCSKTTPRIYPDNLTDIYIAESLLSHLDMSVRRFIAPRPSDYLIHAHYQDSLIFYGKYEKANIQNVMLDLSTCMLKRDSDSEFWHNKYKQANEIPYPYKYEIAGLNYHFHAFSTTSYKSCLLFNYYGVFQAVTETSELAGFRFLLKLDNDVDTSPLANPGGSSGMSVIVHGPKSVPRFM